MGGRRAEGVGGEESLCRLGALPAPQPWESGPLGQMDPGRGRAKGFAQAQWASGTQKGNAPPPLGKEAYFK